MRRLGAGGTLQWMLLLALLLGTAIVGALSLQGQDRPETSDPLVGDSAWPTTRVHGRRRSSTRT